MLLKVKLDQNFLAYNMPRMQPVKFLIIIMKL